MSYCILNLIREKNAIKKDPTWFYILSEQYHGRSCQRYTQKDNTNKQKGTTLQLEITAGHDYQLSHVVKNDTAQSRKVLWV